MNIVLDASAMLAYLWGEPEGEVVRMLLEDPDISPCTHAVNICEVYYDALQRGTEADAEKALRFLQEEDIQIRSDIDMEFWKQLGRFKANYKIALGDSFGLTLAHRLKCQLVTKDQEFLPIIKAGLVQVRFIGE